jgi:hypothetical protein
MANFVQGSAFDGGCFEVLLWWDEEAQTWRETSFVAARRKIICRVYHPQIEVEIEPTGEAAFGLVSPTEGPPEEVWAMLEEKVR